MTLLPVAVSINDLVRRSLQSRLTTQGVLFVILVLTENGRMKHSDAFNGVSASKISDPLPIWSPKYDVKRLTSHLLDKYKLVGIDGRPVSNGSMTTVVTFGLSLLQILDVDEKNGELTTKVLIRMSWRDDLLKWNPANVGGVSRVMLPTLKIWTPDIVAANGDISIPAISRRQPSPTEFTSIDTQYTDHDETRAVVVLSDGSVFWTRPAIIRSSCRMDIENFPFDVQSCQLTFYSFHHNRFELDLQLIDIEIDMRDYIESSEWKYMEGSMRLDVLWYEYIPEPYQEIHAFMNIKRVSIYYQYVLLLPSLLLSLVSFVIFWLPPDSDEKATLGLSVFASFFFLLLLLSDDIPPTWHYPKIGVFCGTNMALTAFSSFLTIIVININKRGCQNTPIPWWLRRITINGLARVLCISDHRIDSRRNDLNSKPQNSKSNRSSRSVEKATAISQEQQPLISECDSAPALRPATASPTLTDCNSSPGNSSFSMRGRPQRSRRRGHSGMQLFCRSSTTTSSSRRSFPPPSWPRSLSTGKNSTKAAYGGGNVMKTFNGDSPIRTSSAMESTMINIYSMLNCYTKRLETKDDEEKAINEWRVVAQVFDRLFFYTNTILLICSLVLYFPRDQTY